MRPPARLAPALLLLAAGTAWSGSPLGPAAGARVPAGEIRLEELGPAEAGAEERELVLSLDGGQTFPLRLTAGIGPEGGAAAWRVPSLPAEHAVLALREGCGGRDEELVALSAEFTIVAGPSAPAEELRFRDGEWKTREADADEDRIPAPSLSGDRPERWLPLVLRADPLEEPARGLLPDPEPPSKRISASAHTDPGDEAPLRRDSSRSLPLRE